MSVKATDSRVRLLLGALERGWVGMVRVAEVWEEQVVGWLEAG